MYESLGPEVVSLDGAEDSDLIEIVRACAQASARAEAVKLAAIAELQSRRRAPDTVQERWACDDWDATASEIGCALNISAGRAIGQMNLAAALRDRFPRLGRLMHAGLVPLTMVTTIVFRTGLVVDAGTLATLDDVFVDAVRSWGLLSQKKLEDAIDVWIDRYDPDAVRRLRTGVRGRSFTIGDRDDQTGITSVFGKLATPDAAVLAQRLVAMVQSVCEDDPRTMAQRRADAVGAMAAGSFVLTCLCGGDACPAAQVDDGRSSSFTVTVVADHSALDTAETSADPAPPRRTAALIPGLRNGIVPAPLLAELIAHGAKIRFVDAVTDCTDGYRPSAALDRFVRSRDLTCRFPGCDRPAVSADIDHTVPWPQGPTHAGNTKCYCRKHHLLKTFWTGWSDSQTPDGTVTVTTPTGHTYTTAPLSALLFPSWHTVTPPPDPGAEPPGPSHHARRSVMMPIRRRTRAQSRIDRVRRERDLNAAQRVADVHIVEKLSAAREAVQRIRSQAKELAGPGDDPPPF
jgi:hypothetical protein